MSYQRIEIVTVTTNLQKRCDECDCEVTNPMYSVVPENELDLFQANHFCSSVCFKRFIIRWGNLFTDGNGARAMFRENI